MRLMQGSVIVPLGKALESDFLGDSRVAGLPVRLDSWSRGTKLGFECEQPLQFDNDVSRWQVEYREIVHPRV